MVEIRRADEGDAEILAELYQLVHQPHLDLMPDRFKPLEMEAASEWFRTRLGKSAVRVWIAESDGAPVGYMMATTLERPETPFRYPRLVCHMDQLAVVPEMRRHGVGRALFDRALTDARERGVQDVEGHSWSFNAGTHELLRTFGFDAQIIRFSRTFS